MPTLQGRVLLGWLSREDAIKFLTEECVFDAPFGVAEAEALWRDARARVNALPDRATAPVPALGLNAVEAGHQAKFFGFLGSIGPHDVIEVRKVDLRELIVRQYHVVTERSEDYRHRLQTPRGWLEAMLPAGRRNSQIRLTAQQTGMDTYTEIDLPHSEFFFGPMQNGTFTANELLGHVTVMDGMDRTYLWAGYHRCFARVLNAPPAAVPSAVVAVAKNVLVVPAPTMAAAGEAAAGIDPLCCFGAKAAKFGDFFVEGLFMDVRLRKKRYQLQVHAKWVALDDPA